MTYKEFMNAVANGKSDVLQIFLDTLAEHGAEYCVIGGLAVNAYVEPVVSLDLDMVIAENDIEKVCRAVENQFTVERSSHSINLTSSQSDFRIWLRTDARYQDFIARDSQKRIGIPDEGGSARGCAAGQNLGVFRRTETN